MQFIEAMRILSALERHGVAYMLVGSMAMAAQGIVRATRDIAVFVSADEPNVARLRAALREVFDDPEVEGISAADLAGEYPAIQYVPRDRITGLTFCRGWGRRLATRTWSSNLSRSRALRSASPRHGCCTA
jgi:hypothetical protein